MIPLVKSTFYKEAVTKKKLTEFIRNSTKLSFGEQCELFEMDFAKWQGRKYCVFLNSGSSANLAIIQTLLNMGKLKRGDSVGFSSLTWSTNVMPIIQLGLIPIPIDIELDTLNISSNKLDSVLKTSNIKCLFVTNLLGFCDDIDNIENICKKNGILLLEDNCEALGSIFNGKKLGNYGLASSFSFYVGHHLSTIEGGAICTDNVELAEMLRIVRAHGWDRNLTLDGQRRIRTKHNINSSFYSRYTFYDLGYNLRPTEISGYLGRVQLKFIDKIVERRQNNFLFLVKVLNESKKFYPIRYNHLDVISNFAYPLLCRTREVRDKIVEETNNKLEIRPIVGGDMTQQPFFKKYFSTLRYSNDNAALVHDVGLYFGNNPELTQTELRSIINILAS